MSEKEIGLIISAVLLGGVAILAVVGWIVVAGDRAKKQATTIDVLKRHLMSTCRKRVVYNFVIPWDEQAAVEGRRSDFRLYVDVAPDGKTKIETSGFEESMVVTLFDKTYQLVGDRLMLETAPFAHGAVLNNDIALVGGQRVRCNGVFDMSRLADGLAGILQLPFFMCVRCEQALLPDGVYDAVRGS